MCDVTFTPTSKNTWKCLTASITIHIKRVFYVFHAINIHIFEVPVLAVSCQYCYMLRITFKVNLCLFFIHCQVVTLENCFPELPVTFNFKLECSVLHNPSLFTIHSSRLRIPRQDVMMTWLRGGRGGGAAFLLSSVNTRLLPDNTLYVCLLCLQSRILYHWQLPVPSPKTLVHECCLMLRDFGIVTV